jgi:hypothetical protein
MGGVNLFAIWKVTSCARAPSTGFSHDSLAHQGKAVDFSIEWQKFENRFVLDASE